MEVEGIIPLQNGGDLTEANINSQICSSISCCETYMEQRQFLTDGRYDTPSSSPPLSLSSEPGLDQNCCNNAPALQQQHHLQHGHLGGEGTAGGNSNSPEGLLSQQAGGSVARRNERERKRVRMVNMGFAKLRQYVPTTTRGKRLSKVETLRSAIDYIRQLRQLLLYHQHYVEDAAGAADYYSHFYGDRLPHSQHHPMPFHFGVPPRHGGFVYDGGMHSTFPGEHPCETGCPSTWSLGSESPSPASIESEMSPTCNGILESEPHMTCWAM